MIKVNRSQIESIEIPNSNSSHAYIKLVPHGAVGSDVVIVYTREDITSDWKNVLGGIKISDLSDAVEALEDM